MLIFFSYANFLDFHTILCKILRIFVQFCCILAHCCKNVAHFCIFLLIFACLYVFWHVFFVLIFQAHKLCQCYFSSFFQLCFNSHTYHQNKMLKHIGKCSICMAWQGLYQAYLVMKMSISGHEHVYQVQMFSIIFTMEKTNIRGVQAQV